MAKPPDPDGTLPDPDQTLPTLPGDEFVLESRADAPELGATLNDPGARARAAKYLDDPDSTSVRAKPKGAEHRLGPYLLHRELGRGAMGVVYEATDSGTGKRVALKVLPPGLAQSEASRQRFVREAEAMAALRHPNILPVYGLGEHEGAHYYSMAIVSGKSLKDIIDAEGLKARDAARFVRDAAQALDYAHDAGVIHRDIKPANLLIEPDASGGKVLVADFGIAKSADHATLTASGTVMGTPMYMSPEQAKGETSALDGRTDVYSLGATLYESLTRAKPYTGEDVNTILRHVIQTDPPAPRRINPAVPKPLEAIVGKAMEKRRDRRYATAGELAEDLERYLKGEAVHARVRGPIARAFRWAGRHKAAAALIVVVTLAALGGGGTFAAVRWQHATKVRGALDRASEALVAGDLDKARDEYGVVGVLEPGHAAAKAGLAAVETARKERAAAAARAKVKEALDAASAAVAAGDFHGARAKFELVNQLDPGNPAVASGLESLDARRRDFAARQARAEAERLTAEANADLRRNSTDAVARAAELKDAEEKALKALDKDPTYEEARTVRVAVALARAHDEIARQQWTDARIYLALAREAAGEDANLASELARLERLVTGTGTLAVTTSPAGARATLERADAETGLWAPPETLGDTPLAPRDLPMGSYRLTLVKDGHAVARWPFVVARNKEVVAAIPLVPVAAVPPGMVHVPAGESLLGDPVRGAMERQGFPAFLIDEAEVTNEAYARFLAEALAADAEGAKAYIPTEPRSGAALWTPDTLEAFRRKEGANLPVGGITWSAADAYARWRGARLPSAAEWERAARGADGRTFPWGQRYELARVNAFESQPSPRPLPVDAHGDGRSPFGCLQMSGNVAEFTATLLRTVEIGGLAREIMDVRGGACASGTHEILPFVPLAYGKTVRSISVGFRCVQDLPAAYGGAQ